MVKLQFSETSKVTGMLENNVKEENKDRLMNCKKQGSGRAVVFLFINVHVSMSECIHVYPKKARRGNLNEDIVMLTMSSFSMFC